MESYNYFCHFNTGLFHLCCSMCHNFFPFFCKTEQYPIVCIYIFCLSIHLLMKIQLFLTFGVVNAMPMGVQISLLKSCFRFFWYIPRSGIAGSYGNSIFNFWETAIWFSLVAVAFTCQQYIRVPISPYHHQHLLFLFFFIFYFIFKRFHLFIFREREGEKHQCVLASRTPPIRDLAHNPGMHPGIIEPRIFWFTSQHAIHWATQTRALFCFVL